MEEGAVEETIEQYVKTCLYMAEQIPNCII